MQNVPVSRQGGLTLIELVVVISVITVIAAIAYPVLPSDDAEELNAAAAEFAAAIRFARTESMSTGEPLGFRFLTNEYRIRVFSADTTGSPWASIWDVYHPIDKQLFDVTFPADLAGSAPPVTHDFTYRGTCNTQGVIYFDRDGTPWCFDPETVLLDSYRLDFVAGSRQRSVSLDGITGRVTVQ